MNDDTAFSNADFHRMILDAYAKSHQPCATESLTELELGQELRSIAYRLEFSHAQLVASEVAEIAYIGIVRDEVGVAVKDLLALAEVLDPGGEPQQEESNEQDDG